MTYRLFREYASRYDLHTPPDHYQHDHAFAIEIARELSPTARVLDVGCGTGVFLQRAREAGLAVAGIDSSAEMVEIAQRRIGGDAVRCVPMQSLDAVGSFDLIVVLQWSLHYCADGDELRDILDRFYRALVPGGRVLLQVAHARNATGELLADRELGPGGLADDVLFLYRFQEDLSHRANPRITADYMYACFSTNELVFEQHILNIADVDLVRGLVQRAGFHDTLRYEGWCRSPFNSSVNPFLIATKPGCPNDDQPA